MMLIQHSVESDWLVNTQSGGLKAYWCILEINEKTTLNVNMPYLVYSDWIWLLMERTPLPFFVIYCISYIVYFVTILNAVIYILHFLRRGITYLSKDVHERPLSI